MTQNNERLLCLVADVVVVGIIVPVQVLIDAKVSGVKDIISTISTEATQEATLEELLANVVSKWASIEFNIVPYKDSKDVFIMGSTDDIQVHTIAEKWLLLLAPCTLFLYCWHCYALQVML